MVGGAQLGELGDHLHQAGAQQRFAAGEADLLDAERDQDPHHAQVVGDGQLGILRAFVAGAAVDALVVAAVGDGDAQVGDGPAEGVAQARAVGLHARRRFRGAAMGAGKRSQILRQRLDVRYRTRKPGRRKFDAA